MGYALIASGGTDGRYSVQLDWGDSQRTLLLTALTNKLVTVELKALQIEASLIDADAREATQRAVVAQVFADYTLTANPNDPATIAAFQTFFDAELKKLFKMQATNAPLRASDLTIKTLRTQTRIQHAQMTALVTIEARDAWCVDFTEAASGYVGTIDIPGESALILIAPGGRAWLPWDGSYDQEQKDAALAKLNSQIAALNLAKTTLDALIVTKTAEEAALRITFGLARTKAASEALTAKQRELATITMQRAGIVAQITEVQRRINVWTARTSSATPVFGDGQFFARELMSPEQVYFNTAILPGWQKERPTYRSGTITQIDYDTEKVSVDLDEATSSAQQLDVNKTPTLSAVPITYMTCGARCFSNGEHVIVQFENLKWANPRMIGYLESPRICPPKFAGTITAPDGDEDEAYSYNISGFWSLGKNPRTYTVVSGALPAGLSINSSGVITGTPTEYGAFADIVVRCSDAFYEATNRRYDESTAFDLFIHAAATWYSGAFADSSWTEVDTGSREVRVTAIFVSSTTLWLARTHIGTGTPPAQSSVKYADFVLGDEPPAWKRLTINSGDSPTSSDGAGTWIASPLWYWGITGAPASKAATFTIDIATDAAGVDIVASITGSVHVENV